MPSHPWPPKDTPQISETRPGKPQVTTGQLTK
jgi:hypothetical protein